MLSLKDYINLNQVTKKLWLDFNWVFQELTNGIHDIIALMKLREEADILIKDYWQTAKQEITKKIKKTSKVIGSHLATVKAGITLSNEEASLLESLKNDLNKKNVYPSKSEILRAGLWSLRKMNSHDLEEALKDLIKVKQTRIL